ncbi:MAG: radical SAM protein [Bdellovibrio sp.]
MAFKWEEDQPPLAFHARNLEVAEISDDVWEKMSNIESPETTEALDELNSWEEEINLDVKSGRIPISVRTLTVNVTQICNLKCTYCAAGGDGTYGAPQTKINVEKTLPQLKFFLERVPEGSTFRITFLGGEPLLYPEGIQEIANYVKMVAAEKNIFAQFSIVTNGTLLTEKNVILLKNINANVTVSLDGPAEINDSVRPKKDGSGSTQAVIDGLKTLLQSKDSLGTVTIHGVFSKENLNLLKAYEFYKTFNVDSYGFTYSVEEKDDESNKAFVEQMNLIAANAYACGGETELRKISVFDYYFNALDNQQQTENFCGAGKSFLMVDSKNNLFTCPWDVGNNEEQVGEGIHLSEKRLSKYAAPLIEQNNCHSCWARFLCGGGCMYIHKKATGSKNHKDGQFCQRTRGLISIALLYYKLSRNAC